MLDSLSLTNFRSYREARFDLDPNVTLVVGSNATGKTNLLEAVYVLASTKSFRAKDKDLIHHGEDFYRIVAQTNAMEYALGFRTSPTEKRVTHDGVKKSLVSHVGLLQVTLFEPTDLALVGGPPEARRRYLDYVLSQTDRTYLKTLQTYRRVLSQRNALLEGFTIEGVRGQIFAWDVKLAQLAGEIVTRRQGLIDYLNARLPDIYAEIAGSPAPLVLTYIPTIETETSYSDDFLAALSRNLPRDLGAGFTTIGPHREDFTVTFKDAGITAVASRGETRTVVLALKMAELAYSFEQTGVRPLLLLDDVFSELDRDRRSYLLAHLHDFQTIITTTDADAVVREIKTPHRIIEPGSTHE